MKPNVIAAFKKTLNGIKKSDYLTIFDISIFGIVLEKHAIIHNKKPSCYKSTTMFELSKKLFSRGTIQYKNIILELTPSEFSELYELLADARTNLIVLEKEELIRKNFKCIKKILK